MPIARGLSVSVCLFPPGTLTSNPFWAGTVGETVVRGGSTYFMFDQSGTCVLYDATGTSGGHLQTSYNDPNVSDNGGWANIALQQ